MGSFQNSLWTIAAMLALPAPAAAAAEEAPDVCGALARIVASAHERPAFRTVQRRLAAGEAVMPGFAAGDCRVTAGEGLSCGDGWGRASFIGWPELSTCRGVTSVPAAAPVNRRPRYSWTRIYRARDVRVEYGMTCAPCAGPAPSHFTVGFFERPRGRRR
jgi:hypothetical protein